MTIMINDSFEFGYDVTIIDNFNEKIIMANDTLDYYDIYKLLEYIKEVIKKYEVSLNDKKN